MLPPERRAQSWLASSAARKGIRLVDHSTRGIAGSPTVYAPTIMKRSQEDRDAARVAHLVYETWAEREQ